VHFLGNGVALLLTLWNLLIRTNAPTLYVPETGLVLSAIVVAILLVTGWLGGELAFRHRIGVVEQPVDLTAAGGVAGQPSYGRAYVDPRSPAARAQRSPAQTSEEPRRQA
jgi:hypothetical protein